LASALFVFSGEILPSLIFAVTHFAVAHFAVAHFVVTKF